MVAEHNGLSAVLSRYYDEDIALVSFPFLIKRPAAKERKVKMVEQGKRIPNIVLKKTAEKLRAKGFDDREVLRRILFFDELAKKGQLLDYLKKKGG
jgi:hypothetical protein